MATYHQKEAFELFTSRHWEHDLLFQIVRQVAIHSPGTFLSAVARAEANAAAKAVFQSPGGQA
jgi:hypothetical protein